MNHPTDPTDHDTPWEEAMSRDFDARVRDLHEAPFDFTAVQGKARRIKRNRRAAVAGSVLGVAAIVTPIAVLSNGGATQTKQPDFANPSDGGSTSTVAPDTPALPDYLQGNVWHQADGDTVDLSETDQPYTGAVLWDGRLVATRSDGEVYAVADVIDESGSVVDSFAITSTVVVNDSGTTIAWVDPASGEVRTGWGDQEEVLGSVELSAPGEAVAWDVAAITGGTDCREEADGCTVYLGSGTGEDAEYFASDGSNGPVAGGVLEVYDATDDGAVSVLSEVTDLLDTCGGLYDLPTASYRWETCDHQVQAISPDGSLVVAPQSQYDGIGPTRLSILDARTGDVVQEFERAGWTVGEWVWTAEGSLVISAVEGQTWHLMTLTVEGDPVDLVDPVPGEEFSSPFRLVRR